VTLYTLILFNVLNHSVFIGSRVAVSLYAIHLHASPFTVGTLMSVYGLVPMLFAVAAGRLTDRIGPRFPLLAGSVLLAIGATLPVFVPGLPALYAAATMIGSGFMLYQVTVQNTVGFIGKPQDRPTNFSVLALGYSFSAFVGPMLTGLAIDSAGFITAFILLAVLPLPGVVVLAADKLHLPRPPTHGPRPAEQRVTDLFRQRELRSVFIISAVQSTAWELFSFMTPIYGSRIGLSASVIGVVMGSFAAATFVVRLSLPYLTRRLTAWRLLDVALLTAGASYLLFPLVTNVAVLMVLAFVLGIGLGGSQPMVMTLLHDAVPEGRTGEAVGIRAAVVTTSQTIMPLLFGALGSTVGVAPAFWAVAVALAAGSREARKRRRHS
jgi:MFS family permease